MRYRQFGVSRVFTFGVIAIVSVGSRGRKRVVRSCQDPRCDAMFQRPYVSDVDP